MSASVTTFFRWIKYSINAKWLLFIFATFIVVTSILFIQPSSLTGSSSKSIFVVGLVNLNLLLLIALAFVVGRNIVRLIFDRRSKVLGSKLRQRLVLAFLLLALVPILIMFFSASGLINKATSGWFSPQVESLYENAINVSQIYLEQQKEILEDNSLQIKSVLDNNLLFDKEQDELQKFIDDLRNKYQLFSIAVFDQNANEVYSSRSIVNDIEDFAEPIINTGSLIENNYQEPFIALEKNNEAQFLRFYYNFDLLQQKHYLVVTKRFDPEISANLVSLQQNFKEYGQLKYFKNPLKLSYLLTLALIAAVILFAAIWFGFYLARELSEPLQKVSGGIKEVAGGNYDVHLDALGDDELSELIYSFNQMVVDLKGSKEEIDQRRIYTETILDNLAVGVIGLSPTHEVVTINRAAEKIFSWKNLNLPIKSIQELFDKEGLGDLKEFVVTSIASNDSNKNDILQKQIAITSDQQAKKIIVTIGQVLDQTDDLLGIVVLVDDITDLANAQKVSAWREVARRLAHEIKNPLTPIKLSAQHLAKKSASIQEQEVQSASKTIVEHVDTIKVLIDEFAKFARLPVSERALANINELLISVVESYDQKSPNVSINVNPGAGVPLVPLDVTQFRQCLVNLLENSIAAVMSNQDQTGEIEIITSYEEDGEFVKLEVSDNGPGISKEDRPRIFDPYFTTKEHGTGLGLSIVASIVSDHQGRIAVFDNQPQGTRFKIELPIDKSAIPTRLFET